MNVVIIKNIIGDEILAEMISDSHPTETNCITVSRPRIIQFQRNQQGDVVPSLVPWLMLDPDNKTVPMFDHSIASIVSASNEVSKSYQSAVSGIVLN